MKGFGNIHKHDRWRQAGMWC